MMSNNVFSVLFYQQLTAHKMSLVTTYSKQEILIISDCEPNVEAVLFSPLLNFLSYNVCCQLFGFEVKGSTFDLGRFGGSNYTSWCCPMSHLASLSTATTGNIALSFSRKSVNKENIPAIFVSRTFRSNIFTSLSISAV